MIFLRIMLFTIGTSIFLAGCSSKKAPDFPRAWKPLNDLPEQATEILLVKQHVYQVTQVDTTVKGLLERWGEEAKLPVIYDHSSDFTLFRKVKSIQQTDLKAALNELSEFYNDKDMVFYIQNGVIMAHKKMGIAVRTNSSKRSKTAN